MPSARELRLILKLKDDASKAVKKFAKAAGASFKKVVGAVRGAAKALTSLKTLLITGFVGVALKKLAGGVLKTGMEFENFEARLLSMTGSSEKAAVAMAKIDKVAENVPFTFQDMAKATVQLQAFLTGTGNKAEDLALVVADLASFMGTTAPEAASAFGRAMAAGAGAADILRDRGVLTLVQMKSGVDDLTKLSLPEFRRVMVETFTDPKGGIAGASKILSKTMAGIVSMLQDATDRIKRAFLDAGVFKAIKDKLEEFLGILKAPVLRKVFADLGKLIAAQINKIDLLDDVVLPLASIVETGAKAVSIMITLTNLAVQLFKLLSLAFDPKSTVAFFRLLAVEFERFLIIMSDRLDKFLRESKLFGPLIRLFGIAGDSAENMTMRLFDLNKETKALRKENPKLAKALGDVDTALQKIVAADDRIKEFFIQLTAGFRTAASASAAAKAKLESDDFLNVDPNAPAPLTEESIGKMSKLGTLVSGLSAKIRGIGPAAAAGMSQATEAITSGVESLSEKTQLYVDSLQIMADATQTRFQLITGAFQQLGSQVTGVLIDLIAANEETARTLPQIIGRMVVNIIRTLAQQFIVEGIGQIAMGLAANATAPGTGAGHFAAAQTFFAAAGIAGVAAGVVGRGVGSGGGGGGGSVSAPSAGRRRRRRAAEEEEAGVAGPPAISITINGAVGNEEELARRVVELANQGLRGGATLEGSTA